MKNIYTSAIVAVLTLLLNACGDNAAPTDTAPVDNTPPPAITKLIGVTGAGVKGPLANAEVNIFSIDYASPELKGELIDVGETNEIAAIQGVEIPESTTGRLILEFIANENTVEIVTNQPPVFNRLVTVVDASYLLSGNPIYASPLTSMAVNLAAKSADLGAPFNGNGDSTITEEEFDEALKVAKVLVTGALGFGLSSSVDIFTAPPLLTSTTASFDSLAETVAYRQAIEAVAAVTILLSNDSSAGFSPTEMLEGLTEDLSDGTVDGQSHNGSVLAFESLTEKIDVQLQHLDADSLFVPGSTYRVNEIEHLIVEETSTTAVTVDTTPLQDGTVAVDLGAPDVSPDPVAETTVDETDTDADGIRDQLDSDDDNDGLSDGMDAFPLDASEQLDTDGDGTGNNADTDDDNDGVDDTTDAFPLDASEQLDTDGDGTGNNADTDDDNDGLSDGMDAFPLDASEQLDTDGDGTGNNADTDDDNDGVDDGSDAFPLDANEQLDTDSDGTGNNADTDDDNDGLSDGMDAFPLDASEQLDTDNDGTGNNADTDDDNDGVDDGSDAFPLDASEQLDTDGDGTGNNADTDDDNDGVDDSSDAFPLDASEQLDTDGDGIGNNADTDDDNDGVDDSSDAFPLDASEQLDTDSDGTGNNADTDDDNDGVDDSSDAFPLDASEQVDTDSDGTGNNADTDDDNDGVDDTTDAFPLDANEQLDTDSDGTGNNADTDDDNDGVDDSSDAFPLDASEQLDTDSDGIGNNADTDDDNDGVDDTTDAFPLDASEQVDSDGDGIGDNSDPSPYPEVRFSQTNQQYVATGAQLDNPANVTPAHSLTYQSSNTAVATVSTTGRVTAISKGSATISAYISSLPRSYTETSYSLSVYDVCAACDTFKRVIDEDDLDIAVDMFEQADGKIVVLSQLSSKYNNGGRALLTRLNADGSLDTSFGTLGQTVHTYTGLSRFSVRDLAVQSSGKILVLGESGVDRTTVVTRFDADGNLDTSFGTSGEFHYNDGIYWQSRSIELDAADNIFVAISDASPDVSVIFRLSAEGVQDMSFDGDGLLTINDLWVADLKVLNDGKLVIAGRLNGEAAVLSFTSNGTVDTSFATAGVITRDFSGSNDWVVQLLQLANDDILVVGVTTTGSRKEAVLLRMSNNGSWKSDFGTSGMVNVTFTSDDSYPYSAIEQDDGKIVLVGMSGDFGASNTHIALSRLNANGTLDTSLPANNSAGNGIVTYDLDYETSFNSAISVHRRENGGYLLLNIVSSDQDYSGIYSFGDTYLTGLDQYGALDNQSFITTGLANEVVTDNDGDGIRDRIDMDDDQDGFFDDVDLYPFDTDNDGIDNDIDPDDDGDGINDDVDSYPFDLDNDGILNFLDPDDDGDGAWDSDDAFPYDASEQYDTDGDGIGNNADPTPYPVLTFALSGDQSIGSTDTLNNPATPASGSHNIQYVSSDTAIATVDASGLVTAVGVGTATISADLTDWPDTPVSYQLTVNNSCTLCVSSTVAIDVQAIDYTTGVAELADGDLVVFGYTESTFFTGAVTRLKFDGTIDSSFNSGAPFEFNYVAGKDTKVIDVVEQNDGKLLLLSEYKPDLSTSDFLVTRLNADGSLDTSYAISGHFLLHDASGSFVPGAMALQSDNYLVVAGSYKVGSNSEATVIRLTDSGSLDPSFGLGSSGISVPSSDAIVYDIALDGTAIVAAGTNAQGNSAILLRLSSSGEIDTTFNTTGIVSFSFLGEQNISNSLIVQSTGQYVISGYLEDGEIYISRYNSDGSLDNAFGTTGIAREGVVSNPFSGVNESGAIIEQSDGTLLVVGSAELNASTLLDTLVLWRFDANGIVSGVTTSSVGLTDSYIMGIDAITSSRGGTIIAVDNYHPSSNTSDMILYRVNLDGSANNTSFK